MEIRRKDLPIIITTPYPTPEDVERVFKSLWGELPESREKKRTPAASKRKAAATIDFRLTRAAAKKKISRKARP